MTAPPKLERLIAALSRLGNSEIAERHASVIFSRMIAVVTPARGHDIGGDDDTGFYARPRTEMAGLERELRDLGGKARKAARGKPGFKAWANAWAALPQRTKRLLWRPKLIWTAEGRTIDPGTVAGSFAAPGLHMIVPRPEVVLPVIEAEIARIKTTPAAQRRKRKRDEAEHAAIQAICNFYQKATGNKGRRAVDPKSGKLTGRLIRLGHEIDRIFGTALFAEKDSRRLRTRPGSMK
jgi:hypothetical protein